MHYGQSLHQRPRRSLKGMYSTCWTEVFFFHRVPWPRGSPTYKVVRDLYCTYVRREYERAIVEQSRCASGKVASTVIFTEGMSETLKKDNFLSNPKNKQRFLSMLSKALQNEGCIAYPANGDADLLNVKTSVDSARTSTTVIVGDQIC